MISNLKWGMGKAQLTRAAAYVQVPIPEGQVHKLKEGLGVQDAATEYAGQLLGLDPSIVPRNDAGDGHAYQLWVQLCYNAHVTQQPSTCVPFV